VPSLYQEIDTWWEHQPAGTIPFKPDTSGREVVNVEMEAGDLLIFNALLAHGVRPNISVDQVRMAQYISMFPADFSDEGARQERIRLWSQQTHPVGDPFPGDPRGFEKSHYLVATLDPLGRKLLGLDPWS
jgi:hypothetical protein